MKKLVLFAILASVSLPLFAGGKKKEVQPRSCIQSVAIERTGCYGRCPSYSIRIQKGGMVTYTAGAYTPDTGTYTKNVGAKVVQQILSKLEKMRVDTCQKAYDSQIPDLPNLNYTIVYKNTTKKIFTADWGPEFLKAIGFEIDEIGKTHDNTWKHTLKKPKK